MTYLKKVLKKIEYIGLTRLKGKEIIIVKDKKNNILHKLPLSEERIKENHCIQDGEGYIAKIGEEYYEVEK